MEQQVLLSLQESFSNSANLLLRKVFIPELLSNPSGIALKFQPNVWKSNLIAYKIEVLDL